MIDKVSQEILKFQYICLQVLIISLFERMSHSESCSQIYFQNDTFAKSAILRTKQLSYIIIYCDDSFLRVKAFMHAWSRATEIAKINEESLVTP